jgi:hypothetical protein
MVAMLGKVLRYLRLYAVLSWTVTLISFRNAIQCGRPWQGCGRCGSAIVLTAVTELPYTLLVSIRTLVVLDWAI